MTPRTLALFTTFLTIAVLFPAEPVAADYPGHLVDQQRVAFAVVLCTFGVADDAIVEDPTPSAAQPVWGQSEGAFRAGTTLKPRQFPVGEPVVLSLWLNNDSPIPASWLARRAYRVEIFDQSGRPVEPTSLWLNRLMRGETHNFEGDSFERQFAPGDVKRQFEFPLHLQFDLSKPGRYEVRIAPRPSRYAVFPLPGEPTLAFEIEPIPPDADAAIVDDQLQPVTQLGASTE